TSAAHAHLPPSPTRRSSDLVTAQEEAGERLHQLAAEGYGIIYITEALAAELKHEMTRYQGQILPAIIQIPGVSGNTGDGVQGVKDRKSTRLNSSHVSISYAV